MSKRGCVRTVAGRPSSFKKRVYKCDEIKKALENNLALRHHG